MEILKEKNFNSPVVAEISNLFTDLEVKEVAAQAIKFLSMHLSRETK
jgi:hypothetical protein